MYGGNFGESSIASNCPASRYFFVLSFSNFSEAELMQYRMPPASLGPSSNTWPKCASHRAHFASVRIIPWLASDSSSTLPGASGAVKLGHPVPDSNFFFDSNSGCPQAAQTYVPDSFASQYFPVNGGSVPFCRIT